MNNLKRFGPLALLVVVSLWFISLAFGELFWQPNDFIFAPAGDGLKNYFTVAHYVKYGGGGRFTAMTYPYGEFALLTDGHFALASILHWIDSNLFEVRDYSVGIVNFLMLFSLAFCPVFVFLILRKFNVAVWYAFLASLVIGFLSPQIQRFIAHYSLSYAVFVPMVWYFLIRMLESRRRWAWAGGLILIINFFGLMHPYYVPLGAFFLLSYGLVYTLQHLRKIKQKYPLNLWIYGTGFAAVIIFMIIATAFDPVTDRHPAPFGIFYYQASFESVFLPSFGPVLDLWQYFTLVKLVTHEGMAYVGVVGLLVLGFTIIRFIKKAWKRKNISAFRFTGSQHLNGMLWGATLLLILATAFPFLHFEFLLEWIPPLKQFRSLGRFAWAFYYVFTIYTAYYFYLVYQSLTGKGNRRIAVSMMLIVLFFWGAEAFINTTYCSKKLHKAKGQNSIFKDSSKDYSEYLKKAGYKAEDFQALLAFPYFNNGSEKFYIFRSNQAVYEMSKCVYELNIPLASFISPRTSLSQAYKIGQLMSSDLIDKEILPELNEKPFLILRTMENMLPDEQALLDKAKRIYANPYIELYELPVSAFESRLDAVRSNYNLIRDSIPEIGRVKSFGSPDLIYFSDFEEKTTPLHFGGKGALYGGKKTRLTFFEGTLAADHPAEIEISVWIYSDNKTASYPALFVEIYEEQNRLLNDHYNPKFFTEYANGWVKATVKIPYAPGQRLVAYMTHENDRITNFIVDNFLIRPANEDVYHGFEEDGTFFYNNYRVGK